MKFYLDEHIPKSVVEGLRRRGVDVFTVHEAGRSGDSDEKQLAFATREGRVLVTFDDDFLRLGHRSPSCRHHLFPDRASNSWRINRKLDAYSECN